MMFLSVSSFPESPKPAIDSKWERAASPKSRRCFFGTLFSKGSGPFLKGVRQLGKTHVKDSVIHPVDDAAASPPRDHSSASRSSVLSPNIIIDIIAVPDSDDPLATPTSHDVPALHPTTKVISSLPTLAAAEHDLATFATVLTKASPLPPPQSPFGDRAHASPKNTPSPAKELHLTIPNADVEQRSPQPRTLFSIKSSSTVSLVGSSGQGRVPEALPPVRARCKSETATSRTASTPSPGAPRKSKRKGRGASPDASSSSPGVNAAASDGARARSHSDVLPGGTAAAAAGGGGGESSFSRQRRPRQNESAAFAAAPHRRRPSTSDDSSTSSTLVGQTKETPPLLSVHISHMRSGSRPTPALSPHRRPKTLPPPTIRAARGATPAPPPPPLPDRPTTTTITNDEDGRAPPPPRGLVTSDSAGPGAPRSAPPSILVTSPPGLPGPDGRRQLGSRGLQPRVDAGKPEALPPVVGSKYRG